MIVYKTNERKTREMCKIVRTRKIEEYSMIVYKTNERKERIQCVGDDK